MLKITKEQFYEACLLLNPEMTEEEVRMRVDRAWEEKMQELRERELHENDLDQA